jgi:hypothetical protein
MSAPIHPGCADIRSYSSFEELVTEFYYLGLAQMKLGRNEAVAESLEEAIRMQPDAAGYKEALAAVRQSR